MVRVVGVLLHGGGQLFHAGGGLLDGGSLLLGTGREIGIAGRDLAGTAIDLFRPLTHGAHGVDQRVLHGLQILGQTPDFAASGQVVGQGQIPFSDARNAVSRALQRRNDRAAQHHKGDDGQQQRQHKGPRHKHQPQLGTGMRLFGELVCALGTDFNGF